MSNEKDRPPAPAAGRQPLPRRFWQSLDEVNGLATAPEDEFLDGPPVTIGMAPPARETRRDFFKLMGLSATAAMAACRRAPEQKILPFTTRPDELVPGVASWYATACGGCDAHCGLLVKTRDGRPIKIEGNTAHPVSRGAVCAVGQASLLGLYDADRSRRPLVAGQPATWADVDHRVREGLDAAAQAGRAIRLVLPWGTGPTEEAALARLVADYADVKVLRFDALGEREAMADAYQAVMGQRLLPEFRLDDAELILGVGADFLGTWLAPAPLARQYAGARDAERGPGRARHVQLESTLTISGAAADTRHALAPSRIVPALAALVRALAEGATGPAAALARQALAALGPVEEPPFAASLGRALEVDDQDDPELVADPLRLEQAVGNLVDNALKHGAGLVTLGARTRSGRVELYVSDEGTGLPPDFISRAFDRFARPDDGRTSGGIGLGLSIVELIAVAHGGDAHVVNRLAGGTEIWLSLPAAGAPSKHPALLS